MKSLVKHYFIRRINRAARQKSIRLDAVAGRRIQNHHYSLHTAVTAQGADILVATPMGRGVQDILLIRADGSTVLDFYFD